MDAWAAEGRFLWTCCLCVPLSEAGAAALHMGSSRHGLRRGRSPWSLGSPGSGLACLCDWPALGRRELRSCPGVAAASGSAGIKGAKGPPGLAWAHHVVDSPARAAPLVALSLPVPGCLPSWLQTANPDTALPCPKPSPSPGFPTFGSRLADPARSSGSRFAKAWSSRSPFCQASPPPRPRREARQGKGRKVAGSRPERQAPSREELLYSSAHDGWDFPALFFNTLSLAGRRSPRDR